MEVVLRLFGTAGACAFFALLFHAPRRSILPAMLAGVGTYGLYLWLEWRGLSAGFASFAASLVAAAAAELFARRMRMPATIFASIAVIPLVPGGGLYRTMLLLSESDYPAAASKGVETLLIAGGIAVALALAAALCPPGRK